MRRSEPKFKPKRIELHIYVDPDVFQAIRESAKDSDRSVTAEVRRALRREYIDGREAQ